MASPTSWEFYKEDQTKILWVNICAEDLEGIAISINIMVEDNISRIKNSSSI